MVPREVMRSFLNVLCVFSLLEFAYSSPLFGFEYSWLAGTVGSSYNSEQLSGHRVKRGTSVPGQVCNVNTTFECGCVDCQTGVPTGGESGVGCCQTVLPVPVVKQAVLITFLDYRHPQLTGEFETSLKDAVANATITYCSKDLVSRCNVTTGSLEALSPSVVLVNSARPDGTSRLEVALAVVLNQKPSNDGTNSVRRRRRETDTDIEIEYFRPLTLDRAKRATTSVQTDDVMKTATLILVIDQHSVYLSNVLGVAVEANARPFEFTMKSPLTLGSKTLTGIVVGSIFGGIFVLICLISARKAIRDRAAMKARIERRKIARQKLTNYQEDEAVQSNGIISHAVTSNGINRKTKTEVIDETDSEITHPNTNHQFHGNTVTVQAEIYQPTNVSNGDANPVPQNGYPGEKSNTSSKTEPENPIATAQKQDYSTQENSSFQNTPQDNLPNGHKNGLPSRKDRHFAEEDEDAISLHDDVTQKYQPSDDERPPSDNNDYSDAVDQTAPPPSYTESVLLNSANPDDVTEQAKRKLSANDRGIDNLSFDKDND